MTKHQLIELLREVEKSLSQDPRHNAWDIGPSDLLNRVRDAVDPQWRKPAGCLDAGADCNGN